MVEYYLMATVNVKSKKVTVVHSIKNRYDFIFKENINKCLYI